MIEEYLPSVIMSAIKEQFNFGAINEIRLRVNCPVVVCAGGDKYFVGDKLVCDRTMMDEFVYKICDNSMYAINDSVKEGYVTLKGGIRVGLCGEVVSEAGSVRTIKHIQAVNIRIPHDIKNCSLFAYDYLVGNEVKNTLILSAPGVGKTTFLRDFVRQLSSKKPKLNLLVADERGEIASVVDGNAQIRLGDYVDVYSYASKEFAFKYGIRSMSPDVFVFDELDIEKDMSYVSEATNSGVKVIATLHCASIQDLKQKTAFKQYLSNKTFDRYVLLTKDSGIGTLTAIFDANLSCIYCR